MIKEFQKQNIKIEDVKFCPHTPDDNCKCRKPLTGMIDNILSNYQIDLENSFMIGDKQSDIDLATNSNISNKIAINSIKLKKTSHQFETIEECYRYFKGKLI
jgi:D-glycero-D-manno-heptose 1,7-bisphosphate phosphatase